MSNSPVMTMREVKSRRGDPAFQIVGERGLLGRDRAHHHGGEIAVARQQPAHRIDKDVAAFLRAHPAETADRVTSGQAAFRKGCGAIGRRRIDVGIDAVRDHGRGALEVRRRKIAGRDDRVHPPISHRVIQLWCRCAADVNTSFERPAGARGAARPRSSRCCAARARSAASSPP